MRLAFVLLMIGYMGSVRAESLSLEQYKKNQYEALKKR
jgi:hypothetical protein